MKVDLNKKIKDKERVSEYEKLKKDYAELEREERQLKDYLNINVFDYAQNVNQIEDIFSLNNFSVAFFNQTKDCSKINPNIPILEVNNLTKYYASQKVPTLLNVTMKLYLGDIHVVVGVNGSGKTTLFNCLRGVEDYDGDILIDGKELQRNSEFEVHGVIGFVPQETGWDMFATVEDIMVNKFSEIGLSEIECQNYIRSSLEQLNISYLRNLSSVELTLLEKKKVQIAISLIRDPHVIVFDELFLGLQQNECLDLMEIIYKLKNKNRAIIAFTHSLGEFSRFANTVSLISGGKLFYTGSIDDLLLKKLHRYVINTENNREALELLKEVKCKFIYKEYLDVIHVDFDGNLNLKGFQKKCADKGLTIFEMSRLEVSLMDDLYPILSEKGSKEAIKEINKSVYFEPESIPFEED